MPFDLKQTTRLDELLAARARALQLVHEAQEKLELAHGTMHPWLGSNCKYWTECNTTDIKCAASERKLDTHCWRYVLQALGLGDMMSSKQMQNFERQISGFDVPKFEKNIVADTFAALYERRHDAFAEGVTDLFQALARRYKTNDPFKVGRKMIVHYIIDYSASGNWFRIGHRGGQQMADLLKVFYVLDGRQVPDNLHQQFFSSSRADIESLETEYFTWKGYKNSNVHITFTRLDLVERVNKLIAHELGARLAKDNGRKR